MALIDKTFYKRVSSEIYWNYKDEAGSKTYPRVLKSIAMEKVKSGKSMKDDDMPKALIDKTFALSDQWRGCLSKTFTKQADDRINDAIIGGTSMSPSDAALSDLRKRIRAAGPRCQPCGKLVEDFIVREVPDLLNYRIEFRCHGERLIEEISRETLIDLKSPDHFIRSLFGRDIFRRKVESDWSNDYPWAVLTSSISTHLFGVQAPGQAPARKQVAAPKTPPKLAPILPAKPVKRAITFED